jgi:hypothetical protein
MDNKNYYDCMHRVYNILKNAKDTTFIIKSTVYKIENSKLYLYKNYNWYLRPLTSLKKEDLFAFEEDLKNILGVNENEKKI